MRPAAPPPAITAMADFVDHRYVVGQNLDYSCYGQHEEYRKRS
jgi:hypothetical protein